MGNILVFETKEVPSNVSVVKSESVTNLEVPVVDIPETVHELEGTTSQEVIAEEEVIPSTKTMSKLEVIIPQEVLPEVPDEQVTLFVETVVFPDTVTPPNKEISHTKSTFDITTNESINFKNKCCIVL